MKNKMNVLLAGIAVALASTNAASAVLIGSGTASGAGGTMVSVPVTVVRGAADVASFAAATFTLSYAQAQLTANPTFTPAGAAPWPGAAGINCTFAAGAANCSFATSGPFTNPVVPAGSYTLGTINFPLVAAPTFPVAITSTLVECTDQTGTKLTIPPAANPQCAPQNGSITAPVGGTAPTLGTLAAATLSGGVSPAGTGTAAVPVATAGTATASVATACSIPAGANAFTITSGAALTFNAPAAVPGTAVVGLSCNRTAAAATATLTCTQTATPAGAALPNLTSTITCPALPTGSTITPAPLGGTAAAPTTLTIANAGAQPIGTVINITGLTDTGANFVAPATGSWGACTYSADATPPAATTSDPTAFTAGPQLVFNSTNNATAQPQVLGATRRAGAVSAILTCPVLPAGTTPGSTTNVYRLVLAAGAPSVVTATTPASGSTTVLAPQAFGGGTSTQVLTFGSTGPGTMNCAVTPASPGYSVAPAVVTLTLAGPNTATVTFTGTTSGTFLGTVVCTPVAPGATGGPFTYNFSTTVAGAPPAAQVQVPALGNISLMLLIAGFLGLGVVLVGRRQA